MTLTKIVNQNQPYAKQKLSQKQLEALVTQQDREIKDLTNQIKAIMGEYKRMGEQLRQYHQEDYRRNQVNQIWDFSIRAFTRRPDLYKSDEDVKRLAGILSGWIDSQTDKLVKRDIAEWERVQREAEENAKADEEAAKSKENE